MSEHFELDKDFFEKVIIFNSLTDESYLACIIPHIKPRLFENRHIRSIMRIIAAFYQKRQCIPTKTEIKAYLQTEDLKTDYKAVVQMVRRFDNTGNKDELLENTQQFFRQRAVFQTLMEVSKKMQEGDIDEEGILADFTEACTINLEVDIGLDFFEQQEAFIDSLTQTDEAISTGWEWFDKKLDGGWRKRGRAFYVFVGQPNVGKSIVLGNAAVNICKQGHNVLLLTFEMSEMLYGKRIASNASQIGINDLKHQAEALRDVLTQFKQDHNLGKLIIKEYPPSSMTVGEVNGYVRRVVDSGIEIHAIVVDYLNLLKSTLKGNLYEKVKDISEQLRALSYIYECPVISATQFNKDGWETTNPDMKAVSESGGLPATADAMFSIWESEEDRDMGVIRCGLLKNRFGINFGSTALVKDVNTLTLTDGDDLVEQVAVQEDDKNSNANALNPLDLFDD